VPPTGETQPLGAREPYQSVPRKGNQGVAVWGEPVGSAPENSTLWGVGQTWCLCYAELSKDEARKELGRINHTGSSSCLDAGGGEAGPELEGW